MSAVIVDIDGTLADCRHRLHHVTGARRDWNAFFGAMHEDSPIDPVRQVVNTISREHHVILCSGRPEDYRAVTEGWLNKHFVTYDRLYMRPAGDTRPDHIVKAQILRGMRDDGYDPFVVIDDRQSVVDMWRDNGLVCLQCAPQQNPIPATAKLTLMVGPCGAGKSTWVDDYCDPSHVISSDRVREDLCGDFRDQSRNHDVFEAVHAIAKTRLKHGLPVVIDATHIRRKDRLASALLVPDTVPVEYIVTDRPLGEKIATAGWRAEVPGLIERHHRTFEAQLKDILRGDDLPNVSVRDLRLHEWNIQEAA